MGAAAERAGGLRKVVAGESRISSIDGERGVLAYAGIDIHALAEQSGFEEVVFLLHEGRLPTRLELLGLRAELAGARSVPAPVVALLRRREEPVEPEPAPSHAANFLYMLEGARPLPTADRAMDVAFVLHADHEFNASTFAARVAASTLADMHG